MQRNVLVKKWILNQYIGENSKRVHVVGTGCFEDDYTTKGIFHQWGSSFEEFDNGAANFTTAIVEFEDGTVEEVLPKNIKFID